MKVYLAGGIEKRKDGGKTWRRRITPLLDAIGIQVVNPCLNEGCIFDKHDIQPSELENAKMYDTAGVIALAKDIKKRDLDLIDECGAMIAYYDESVNKSSGTLCELDYAYLKRMPIYLIRKVKPSSISLWTYSNFDPKIPIFETIDECVKYLKENI